MLRSSRSTSGTSWRKALEGARNEVGQCSEDETNEDLRKLLALLNKKASNWIRG